MLIEYDPTHDLLYIWFRSPGEKAAQTITIVPGVHADLDAQGRLVGIEVLDATEVLGHRLQFEGALPERLVQTQASLVSVGTEKSRGQGAKGERLRAEGKECRAKGVGRYVPCPMCSVLVIMDRVLTRGEPVLYN